MKPPDESPGVFVFIIRCIIPRERSDRGNPHPLQWHIMENGLQHRSADGFTRTEKRKEVLQNTS